MDEVADGSETPAVNLVPDTGDDWRLIRLNTNPAVLSVQVFDPSGGGSFETCANILPDADIEVVEAGGTSILTLYSTGTLQDPALGGPTWKLHFQPDQVRVQFLPVRADKGVSTMDSNHPMGWERVEGTLGLNSPEVVGLGTNGLLLDAMVMVEHVNLNDQFRSIPQDNGNQLPAATLKYSFVQDATGGDSVTITFPAGLVGRQYTILTFSKV